MSRLGGDKIGLPTISLGKLPKLFSIGNFVIIAGWVIGFSLKHPCFCFALKLEVDSMATDLKRLSGFVFWSSIQLNGINPLLAQILAIGFGYAGTPSKALITDLLIRYSATRR